MGTMDDYEKARFDSVADGLSKTTAVITNIQQLLNDHVHREERDRENHIANSLELTKTLTLIQAQMNGLSEDIKNNNKKLSEFTGHIMNCRVNMMSNKKLVGIAAMGSGAISAFVSAAAWAVQHYKG